MMNIDKQFVKQYLDFELYIIQLIQNEAGFICQCLDVNVWDGYIRFESVEVFNDEILFTFSFSFYYVNVNNQFHKQVKIPYKYFKTDKYSASRNDYIYQLKQQRELLLKQKENEKLANERNQRYSKYLELKKEFENVTE